jgi:hypothetical protein
MPEIPQNLSDDQFVDWLYIHVLKYPMVDVSAKPMWLSHLKQGVSREALLSQFISIGNQQIDVSKARHKIRQAVDGKLVAQENKHNLEII